MKIIPIKTKSKHYKIYIGNNALSKFSKIIRKENLKFKKTLIIVDKKVPKIFLNKLKAKSKLEKSIVYLFSASEKNKNFYYVNSILKILFINNFTRSDVIICLGGGIAGDFPICVVPMLYQDLEKKETPFWSYFCQISDSTTSYGSYSGAIPNEKITWGKLDIDTPKFIIESDATIVAPLIFAYLLNW